MKAPTLFVLMLASAALADADSSTVDGPFDKKKNAGEKYREKVATAAVTAAAAAGAGAVTVAAADALSDQIEASSDENQLPKKSAVDIIKKVISGKKGSTESSGEAYPQDRKLPMVWGVMDQSVINPVTSIVKNHDKAQIRDLKDNGKISEGFPDLNFVHIPKTGGDAFALASTPIFPYGFNMRANLALNLMVDVQKQGPNHCYFEQLPPKEIAAMYSKKISEEAYEKRTVFCAVRNPHDRMVSEWQNCLEFGAPGKCGNTCDKEDLNRYVQTELTAFMKGDYLRNTCFLIPQVDYMEGPGGCSKVLDFNHLERDFNDLMEEYGYNLKLPTKTETHRTYSRKCQGKVTAADLDATSKALIEKVYERDFKELGPKYGWVEQSIGDKIKEFFMAPIRALTTYSLTEQSSA